MYQAEIKLNPARPNLPLRPLWIAAGSSGTVTLSGVPDGAETVRIAILGEDGATAAAVDSPPGGEIWIEPAMVPRPCSTWYAVICRIAGRTVWMGSGMLTVEARQAGQDDPVRDLGVYVPVDGALTAEGRQVYALLRCVAEPETGETVTEVGEGRYVFVGGEYLRIWAGEGSGNA